MLLDRKNPPFAKSAKDGAPSSTRDSGLTERLTQSTLRTRSALRRALLRREERGFGGQVERAEK